MAFKTRDKIIVGVLIVLIAVFFIQGQRASDTKEFTKAKWEHYTDNSRQIILDDFINRTTVVGLDRAGVEELLGEADETTEDYMIYYLGNPTGTFGLAEGPQVEYLLFTFADGEVTQLEKVLAADLPEESAFHPTIEGSVLYPEGVEAE